MSDKVKHVRRKLWASRHYVPSPPREKQDAPAPARRRAPAPDGGEPPRPTSDPRLVYERLGRGHWRLKDVASGLYVGPVYESERALLADLPRVASGLREHVERARPKEPKKPKKGRKGALWAAR